METSRQILKTALEMFSRRGCDAVSIRDIAYAVGIKESSIYYHFKSKQAIVDRLQSDVEAEIERMRAAFLAAFDGGGEVEEEPFVQVALHYRHAFFEGEPTAQFIGMLSIERHADERSAALYRRLVFDLPLAHQARVFAAMQARGIFRPGDAALLAREYQYAVYGAFMEGTADEALAALIRRLYRREKNG